MRNWLLLVCLLPAVAAAADAPWTWKDSNGATRSLADLNQVLNDNTAWVNSQGRSGTQGSLAHADLRGATLAGRDLRGLDLTGAILDNVNLTSANLNSSDFAQTDLTQASLRGANLNGAHLQGVYLGGGDMLQKGADLSNARLTVTDFTGADLTNAVLTGADLEDTILTGAQLEGAELKGALYQPTESPVAYLIGTAEHLANLRYADDPQPMVQLRNELLEAGYEQAGREVNRAYHQHSENSLQRLLFDWTCAWGADPMRPMIFVAVLCGLCTLIYWTVMHFEWKSAGLYRNASARIASDPNGKKSTSRILVDPARWEKAEGGPDQGSANPKVVHGMVRRLKQEGKSLATAFMFSLMCVFAIGVEGFNGAQWIRMLQPNEYVIHATGWVKTVAGLQSLLGAGLIALSLLSYFGHPFW
jgi:uncharacterized protein YjbI with pentapeptide repeats